MEKYEVKEDLVKAQEKINEVKRTTKKTIRKAQKWAKEHKDELAVAGILAGTAVVGGAVGYRIHVKKAEKGLDKTLKLIRESEAVYTHVFDKKTKETTEIISMTVDKFGKMIKDLEGVAK